MKSFFYMFNTKFFVLTFFVFSFTNLSAQTVDSDGDGIANNLDLDDDNDGILDTVEDVCSTKTEGSPVFSNTFGTGTTTGSDPNVLLHTLAAGDPSDGSYIVTTSLARSAFYTKTNLSPTSDKDAGYNVITLGDITGRYLMINVGSTASLNQAIYRVSNLAVIVGRNYRFRIDMAGLADALADVPSLQLTIRNASNNSVLATANSNSMGMANDDVWRRLSMEFVATSNAVTLEIVNLQGNGGSGNDLGVDNIVLTPYSCDLDADGIPNSLDTDSDGDGCPDAVEGLENVTYSMVNPLAAANPGQINVRFNGNTTGTPSQIISTATAANGVPQLVNNSANNTNASIGLSGTAGVADNTGTSPVAGVGQAIGNSQNSALNDCKCYRNPTTTLGTDNATMNGVTSFNRAGVNNTNWPMVRNNGWTALEANTKAFVMNRMPVATTTVGTTVIAGEPVNASNVPVISTPVIGMTFYDTTNNCMKVNVDGTRTGWKCFNTQSCPEEN